MSAPAKLAALRHLLAERFPSASGAAHARDALRLGRTLPTGLPALDETTGGLPLGAITEVVCAAPSCGGHLLLGQLLAATRATRTRVALIDSTDSFDPASFPVDLLAHLVWVRCADQTADHCRSGFTPRQVQTTRQSRKKPAAARRPAPPTGEEFSSSPAIGPATAEALHAADLLTRDANFGLLILDLRRASAVELRRTPSTHWYRLQRAVESTDLALVVETPHASVPSARLRFALTSSLSIEALELDRPTLATRLAPRLHRQRQIAAAAG